MHLVESKKSFCPECVSDGYIGDTFTELLKLIGVS